MRTGASRASFLNRLLAIFNMHEQNETLVDRLIAHGSDLSLEAALKIEALRRRGKHWEIEAKTANRKYMQELLKRMRLSSFYR